MDRQWTRVPSGQSIAIIKLKSTYVIPPQLMAPILNKAFLKSCRWEKQRRPAIRDGRYHVKGTTDNGIVLQKYLILTWLSRIWL